MIFVEYDVKIQQAQLKFQANGYISLDTSKLTVMLARKYLNANFCSYQS